jgi:23S rRNA (guanine2445-N2)-methyltransferase / 23S rRNA (guanine2069-N7)-methyltransferase
MSFCARSPEVSAFFATCPKGLEYLLVEELRSLGAVEVHEALAGVHFEGSLEIAYRACLWSRLASRILMPIATFPAADDAALYQGVAAVDWRALLADGASFAVDAVGATTGIRHTQYAARRTKDAIVDQYRARGDARPSVDPAQPALRLHLRMRQETAVLSLDLSGAPLHQRGYRQSTGIAPLKENLAAAILLRAGWPAIAAAGGGLVDPLCGSGTLPIEAALLAGDVAPALRRRHFGWRGWRGHDARLWDELYQEALARAARGLQALRPVFFGFDHDADVLVAAKRNAQAAGVAEFLRFEQRSLDALRRPNELSTPGLLVCNPPYGERMGTIGGDVRALYHVLGEKLRAEFVDWRASVLTSDAALGRALGLRAQRSYRLYNGAIACTLFNFDLATRLAEPRPPKPLSAGAEMLKNRLRKNFRHGRKRAEREATDCWRVYDADLPEYAAAIDRYADHLHVQEYQAPASVDVQLAQVRLRELVQVASEVLGVPRERIAVKTRRRGRGGARYGRLNARGEWLAVREGGLTFLVNLWDYLDTGLFLDHRPLRARIRELAAGKRFLNLFCYTGSVTVYAAAGGACETTSVDLSATYLDWAARNLAVNGLADPRRHRLIRADALEFVECDSARYDLIFVDPPTFSNSKRAEDFDVQRDHVRLLQACARRLAPSGRIVFSNNYRRFKLAETALTEFMIRDITPQTIGFDFERQPRIHRVWELAPG